MKDELKEKLNNINKRKAIFTALIILIVLYRLIFGYTGGIFEKREKINSPQNTEASRVVDKGIEKKENNSNAIIKNEENKKITVYISGAVANPGVITIETDKRLDDAVKKVGGFTKDADLERINLAMKVEDSQHYIIPEKGDDSQLTDSKQDLKGDNQLVGSQSSDTMKSNTNGSSNGKININLADQSQLETIPGVGPSTAKKIIDYREKEGKFSEVEDIKNISGIGDKKFENMQEYISTQ